MVASLINATRSLPSDQIIRLRSIADRQSGSTAAVARECNMGWNTRVRVGVPEQELCIDVADLDARQANIAAICTQTHELRLNQLSCRVKR